MQLQPVLSSEPWPHALDPQALVFQVTRDAVPVPARTQDVDTPPDVMKRLRGPRLRRRALVVLVVTTVVLARVLVAIHQLHTVVQWLKVDTAEMNRPPFGLMAAQSIGLLVPLTPLFLPLL